MFKQVIAVRQDLSLSKLEFSKVVAWASLNSAKKMKERDPEKLKNWLNTGQKKIVIKIKNLEILNILIDQLERSKNIIYVSIHNHNDFIDTSENNEILAIGIGPEKEKVLQSLTSKYKLY